VSVITQVDKLVVPLRDDSEGVFEESHDNQEAANGWEIPVCGPLASIHGYDLREARDLCLRTYGLMGSEMLSKKSSIFPVVSLTFSSGLGSFVP